MLKADIRKYVDTVDHGILLLILDSCINDECMFWLCRVILDHFNTVSGKSMPLGNLTLQFFANVYLNELDQFVKHALKVSEYVRYVDDFVIVGDSILVLFAMKEKTDAFLEARLALGLHSEKSYVSSIGRGIDFLSMRVFQKHRLLRWKNA